MINEIHVNGKLVINEFPKKQFRQGYKIRCTVCNNLIDRKYFSNKVLQLPYECKLCVLKNRNPMHDPSVKKHHQEIVSSLTYKLKLSEACSGDKNGFYGKVHKKETVDRIKKSFVDWKNNLTDDEYIDWTQKMSIGQKKLQKTSPEFYKKIKQKAAYESHKSQFKNWNLNNIEKTVYDYLKLKSKYTFIPSVILGHKQFDFGCGDTRILIEVDGDYWHGNPNFYNEDGSGGKRKLNKIQLKKRAVDKEKSEWASSHNFKLIRLWESEIINGTFVKKLEEVL
jgi:very-short-patch-repair endonuclease